MRFKKGVSPLIATVLLLAFAVALSTVIIQIYPAGTCKLSGVNPSIVGSTQRICFNNVSKEVEVFIENKDKLDVVGFKIKASGSRDTLNIEHIALRLNQNEEKKLKFGYDELTFGKIVGLEIFPQVNKSNSIEDCEMKDNIIQIPLCS